MSVCAVKKDGFHCCIVFWQRHLSVCLCLCLDKNVAIAVCFCMCVRACATVLQVRLKSPSSKPIKYQAFLLGENAHFFCLPDGSSVTIPPKYVFYLENESHHTKYQIPMYGIPG